MWNARKSIQLSLALVDLCILVALVCAFAMPTIAAWHAASFGRAEARQLSIAFYCCLPFALLALGALCLQSARHRCIALRYHSLRLLLLLGHHCQLGKSGYCRLAAKGNYGGHSVVGTTHRHACQLYVDGLFIGICRYTVLRICT